LIKTPKITKRDGSFVGQLIKRDGSFVGQPIKRDGSFVDFDLSVCYSTSRILYELRQ
jgi:hypothetical protein